MAANILADEVSSYDYFYPFYNKSLDIRTGSIYNFMHNRAQFRVP